MVSTRDAKTLNSCNLMIVKLNKCKDKFAITNFFAEI